MIRTFLIGVVLALSCRVATAQAPSEEPPPQPLLCVGPERARQLFFEKGLVPPIRAMRQAAASAGAEAIDIQLCWFRGELVYDVTLLDRNGSVTHRLMSGMTAAPLGERGKP